MTTKNTPRIIVRRAQEDDIPNLAASLYPAVSSEQVAMRWQQHQKGWREMLIAEVNRQIVGTVSIGGGHHIQSNSLRMFALDVGTGYRNQGIGTVLTESVEKEAMSRGLRMVNLEVAVENTGATCLYERLGYRRVGEPIIDSWQRMTDACTVETVEEKSWIMTKTL